MSTTLTCPICLHAVEGNDRLILEPVKNGTFVVWHVKDFSEERNDSGEKGANYSGWCGNNFGSFIPNLMAVPVTNENCDRDWHIHS